MITPDLFQFGAAAFAICGLAVLVWEIAVKDPHSFREMARDSRQFAECPLTAPTKRDDTSAPASDTDDADAANLAPQ